MNLVTNLGSRCGRSVHHRTVVHLDPYSTPDRCARAGIQWGHTIRVVMRQTPSRPQSTAPMDSYYLDSDNTGEATAPWA
jgi:hypothetical protein